MHLHKMFVIYETILTCLLTNTPQIKNVFILTICLLSNKIIISYKYYVNLKENTAPLFWSKQLLRWYSTKQQNYFLEIDSIVALPHNSNKLLGVIGVLPKLWIWQKHWISWVYCIFVIETVFMPEVKNFICVIIAIWKK